MAHLSLVLSAVELPPPPKKKLHLSEPLVRLLDGHVHHGAGGEIDGRYV